MIVNLVPVNLSTLSKPGHLKMKLTPLTSNITEASVELYFETHSRERRQVVAGLVIGTLTTLATDAVESWIHKSRMVSFFLFSSLF